MCCDSHSIRRYDAAAKRREAGYKAWATRRANLARFGGVASLPGVPDDALTTLVAFVIEQPTKTDAVATAKEREFVLA